jgi:hypothetical protein
MIMKSRDGRLGKQQVQPGNSPAAPADTADVRSRELLLALRDRPSALGPGAMVALPPTAGSERAGRRQVSGPEAAQALTGDRREFGSWQPVFLAAHSDRIYGEFLEVNPAGGSPQTSASVMAVMAPGPSVFRLTVFRHAYVPDQPPARAGNRRASQDGAWIALHYLQELEAGRAAPAAACFAEGAIYSVPPRDESSDRITVQGRAAIEAVFNARGTNSARHRTDRLASCAHGCHAMLDGAVTGLPGGVTSTFMSSVTLDDAGLIARYVARICVPGVSW